MRILANVFALAMVLFAPTAFAAITITETPTAKLVDVKVDRIEFSQKQIAKRKFFSASLKISRHNFAQVLWYLATNDVRHNINHYFDKSLSSEV